MFCGFGQTGTYCRRHKAAAGLALAAIGGPAVVCGVQGCGELPSGSLNCQFEPGRGWIGLSAGLDLSRDRTGARSQEPDSARPPPPQHLLATAGRRERGRARAPVAATAAGRLLLMRRCVEQHPPPSLRNARETAAAAGCGDWQAAGMALSQTAGAQIPVRTAQRAGPMESTKKPAPLFSAAGATPVRVQRRRRPMGAARRFTTAPSTQRPHALAPPGAPFLFHKTTPQSTVHHRSHHARPSSNSRAFACGYRLVSASLRLCSSAGARAHDCKHRLR